MHFRRTESGCHQPASLRHEATGTQRGIRDYKHSLQGAVRLLWPFGVCVCVLEHTTWAAITTPDRP